MGVALLLAAAAGLKAGTTMVVSAELQLGRGAGAAVGDLSGRGELRRRRRDRHRRAGQFRHRADARRLRGLRGRQAAEGRDVLVRRAAGGARRSGSPRSIVRSRSDARSNQRPFDGRVYVLVLDDLDISPLRTSLVKKSAREFIESHFGANDLAAVVYTSGRTDATQDFTSDRSLLLAAIDKFVGRRLRSAAIEALEKHYHRRVHHGSTGRKTKSIRAPASPTRRRPSACCDLEREQRALAVLDTLRNLGEFLAGVRGPPQSRAAVQRGARNAAERDLQPPHADRRRRRDPGRDHGRGAIERQLLCARSRAASSA